MSFDDEQLLAEAATHCDSCMDWIEYCKAECCRGFAFELTPRSAVVYLEDTVRIRAPISPDLKRYYELHGAQILEGEIVVVPRANCQVSPTRLFIKMRCSGLQDNLLCALHEEGQPDCCKDFTLETVSDGDWIIPSRCLFKYKLKTLDGSSENPSV